MILCFLFFFLLTHLRMRARIGIPPIGNSWKDEDYPLIHTCVNRMCLLHCIVYVCMKYVYEDLLFFS